MTCNQNEDLELFPLTSMYPRKSFTDIIRVSRACCTDHQAVMHRFWIKMSFGKRTNKNLLTSMFSKQGMHQLICTRGHWHSSSASVSYILLELSLITLSWQGPGSRGCKHLLEFGCSKCSVLKNCGQPNMRLYILTLLKQFFCFCF